MGVNDKLAATGYEPRKVYISGPMTGYPDYNFAEFNFWADTLTNLGYLVLNPADNGAAEPGKTWSDYLRHDVKLVADADMLAVLDGWQASRGAVLEVHIAHALGMTVLPVRLVGQP